MTESSSIFVATIIRRAAKASSPPGSEGSGAYAVSLLEIIKAVLRELRVETAEEAFRRGYWDGFLAGVKARQQSQGDRNASQRLSNFINRELRQWMDAASKDKRVIHPPMFK